MCRQIFHQRHVRMIRRCLLGGYTLQERPQNGECLVFGGQVYSLWLRGLLDGV